MAVSNSIGSNVFDILVGLGLPWALKTLAINYGSAVSTPFSSAFVLNTKCFIDFCVDGKTSEDIPRLLRQNTLLTKFELLFRFLQTGTSFGVITGVCTQCLRCPAVETSSTYPVCLTDQTEQQRAHLLRRALAGVCVSDGELVPLSSFLLPALC